MAGWRHELSRHERGYGYQWTKTRERILRRDGYLCQPCYRLGRPTPATQVDHITPKAQDGTDDSDNLQAICTECHKVKTKTEALQASGTKQRTQYDEQGFPIWE